MDWISEIREAMLKLKEACGENTQWAECYKCPFDEYCTVLLESKVDIPDTWDV